MNLLPGTLRCSRTVLTWLLAAAGLGALSAAAPMSPQVVCGTTVPPGLVAPTPPQQFVQWTLTGSPYCVTGNIQVSNLVIDPGVQVLVAGPYSISVISRISAVGMPAQHVVFAAKTPAMPWKGIKFQDNPCDSQLICCDIRDSDNSGLELINTSPTIESCTFMNNTNASGSGGGIRASLVSGDLILRDCVINENSAQQHGGGLDATMSIGTLRLTGCTIASNSANLTQSPGGYVGGGVHISGSSYMSDSKIVDNAILGQPYYPTGAGSYGGGIYSEQGSCTIEQSIISSNSLYAGTCTQCGSAAYGGGLYMYTGTLTMKNVIVGCNSVTASTIGAAGIYVDSATATIENCTIARNNYVGLENNSSVVNIVNTIVYFNNMGGPQVLGTIGARYSDCQGGCPPVTGNMGNIMLAPAFSGVDCNMTSYCVGALVIAIGSPCVDMGDPAMQYNDCFFGPSQPGVRNDMGAHGGPLAKPSTCGSQDCVSRALSRNGSGVNPVLLTNVTAPILNTTWMVDLDCTSRPPPPNLAVLVGVSRPTTGPTVMSGEILVDVFCGIDLLRKVMPHNGGVAHFSCAIPNNLALCGLDGYFQGVCFGLPKAILSNALDIRIGSK